MRIARVTLCAPAELLPELAQFYGASLDLPVERAGDAVAVRVGESEIVFTAATGAPFYHVALLVPGDRGEAARAWAAARVDLLPDSGTGDRVFDFASWDARAVYFHDPAGSIVELITHAGLDPDGRAGRFAGEELVGISEVGLVGDTGVLACALHERLGLRTWDGAPGLSGRLGFVGEKGRTLIVAPPGRGWLPTGRPAEEHPLDLDLTGVAGEVEIGAYRIRGAESDGPPAA